MCKLIYRPGVIVLEGSEKTPLLFKTIEPLREKTKYWKKEFISRCIRCNKIFASITERKYCSKKCQYNRN